MADYYERGIMAVVFRDGTVPLHELTLEQAIAAMQVLACEVARLHQARAGEKAAERAPPKE